MKKLDKLILGSFIGPFILTFLVAVFILLTQYMLKYFDEFVGKNLGFEVFVELILYFSINMTPVALPLAVLLSSLMTYGNLGEHFELTAIKSAGITMLRALRPLFLFVILLTIAAFFSNNHIVPAANLKAYSLLYDIKQKKPSLDIKEGQFYNGIPGYSIKVKQKSPDGISMKDLIIYNHTASKGNVDVIMADSGRMYTFMNDRYMMLELFNGNNFTESESSRPKKTNEPKINNLVRTEFEESKMVFSLASFAMNRTQEDLFASNRMMKNIKELNYDIDSMNYEKLRSLKNVYTGASTYYSFHLRNNKIPYPKEREVAMKESPYWLVKQKRDSMDADVRMESSYEGSVKKQAEASKKGEETMPKTHERRETRLPEKETLEKALGESKAAIQGDDSLESMSTSPQKDGREAQNQMEEKQGEPAMADRLKTKKQLEKEKRDKALAESKNPEEQILKGLNKGEESSKANIADPEARIAFFTKIDSIAQHQNNKPHILNDALSKARFIKNYYSSQANRIDTLQKENAKYKLEKYKKYSQAVACLVMFLIGAPLGAIIKKGGLGVPVLLSIMFFIVFYVLTIMGEKWAKELVMAPEIAVWVANILLLPFGILFLFQARNDSRLFDIDALTITVERWIKKRRGKIVVKEEEMEEVSVLSS